jgi:hypothetical protein
MMQEWIIAAWVILGMFTLMGIGMLLSGTIQRNGESE